jgi:hypothetical protein
MERINLIDHWMLRPKPPCLHRDKTRPWAKDQHTSLWIETGELISLQKDPNSQELDYAALFHPALRARRTFSRYERPKIRSQLAVGGVTRHPSVAIMRAKALSVRQAL